MEEPNWNDIHDPIKFFKLDEDFDRKTLKRAYTKLIKQFKPEKFPEEFQKIRQAYEELEEELAYGIRRPHLPSNELSTAIKNEVLSEQENNDSTEEFIEPILTPRKSFIEQVQEKGKTELLKELRSKDNKQAEDYIALAVLEEEESQNPIKFLENILTGLKYSHSHAELNEALFQFCRAEYPVEIIPEILEMIRLANPEFSYFYLTEELWKTLLKKESIEDFTSAFKILEMKPSDQVSNYCIFLIRTIKDFYFKLPQEWLNNQYEFIEENIFELGDNWDYELDFLELIKKYQEKLPDFLAVHDYRQKIHVTIQKCLESDYHDGENAFLSLQEEMIRLENWAEVFPFEDQSAETCLSLLSHIQYFYLDDTENEEDFDESSSGAVRFKLHEFSRKMDSQFNKGLEGITLSFISNFYWIIHIAIAFLLLTLASSFVGLLIESSETKTLIAFLIFATYMAYIRPTFLDEYKDEIYTKLSSKRYEKNVRHHVISLFLELQISEKAFYSQLHTLNENDDELISPYFILSYLNKDYAPSFAAISAKFQ